MFIPLYDQRSDDIPDWAIRDMIDRAVRGVATDWELDILKKIGHLPTAPDAWSLAC